MFTAYGVRSIQSFGYSYPELPDWEMSEEELAANVRSEVNSLYNPSVKKATSRATRDVEQRSANLADSFGHVTLEMAQNMGVNNLERQWAITVLVDRYPLDTSFLIDFFMGDAPHDVSSWASAKNLIGTYAQFGPANVSLLHPEPPAGQVSSEIAMTHTLAAGVHRGFLKDLSPSSVVPLLRKGLNWRARNAMGEEIPLSTLSGLVISVYSRSVIPANTTDQFPVYGPLQWERSVTKGKPCGAS